MAHFTRWCNPESHTFVSQVSAEPNLYHSLLSLQEHGRDGVLLFPSLKIWLLLVLYSIDPLRQDVRSETKLRCETKGMRKTKATLQVNAAFGSGVEHSARGPYRPQQSEGLGLVPDQTDTCFSQAACHLSVCIVWSKNDLNYPTDPWQKK